MEFLNDNWSYLSGPVIDNLVAVLRRLDRWKIDGPNLRSLNRHWREQIDCSVTQIRPAGKGEFCWGKLESLSKFPNLRQLRLDPFLVTPSPVKGSTKLLTRMDCLTQLRSLRDLDLRGRASRNLRLLPPDIFPNLTSVAFKDVNFTEGTSISFLRLSPIQSLTFIGKSCCLYLQYPWIRTLRSLDFVTNSVSPVFMDAVTDLTLLNSLSISARRGESLDLRNSDNLSHLMSLMTLHLPDSYIDYPYWITSLSKLESLKMRVKDYDRYEEWIWRLLKKLHFLKSLALFHKLNDVKFFLEFYKNAKNLMSLNYLAVQRPDFDYISRLTQLTRLGIECDTRTPRVEEIFALPSLQECYLRGDNMPRSILHHNGLLFKNLIVLEIDSYSVYELLYYIACFQSLQKLCFYFCHFATWDQISRLEKLPCLKELCLSYISYEEFIPYTSEFVSIIEKLDLLCLSHCCYRLPESPWLRTLQLRVKITNSLPEFSNLSKIGQKSLRYLY
eukprot:g6371.t1